MVSRFVRQLIKVFLNIYVFLFSVRVTCICLSAQAEQVQVTFFHVHSIHNMHSCIRPQVQFSFRTSAIFELLRCISVHLHRRIYLSICRCVLVRLNRHICPFTRAHLSISNLHSPQKYLSLLNTSFCPPASVRVSQVFV